MKVLMIGLGSIGQRHLRNIRRVCGEEAEILAYRVRGLQRTFSDTMQIRQNVSLEDEFHITSYGDLGEALAQKPDIAFITNPTNMHIPCAIQCAKAGCHLFLEKPISDDLSGIDALEVAVRENDVKVFVGYQNRFHPGIRAVKETVDSGELGRILSVHAVVGERLTTMHTYEDYKDTYMARKDMGGGVVTNQLVHEMDYLYYLFGKPVSVYAIGGTLGNLGIDVEDNCDALFVMEGRQGSRVSVNVHADFYQSPPSRFVKVVGEKGQIEADLINALVTKTVSDVTEHAAFPEFARNDMFIEELKLFLSCIKEGGKEAITLEDGIVSLKMAMAVKESMKTGGVVNVDL
ncbi:MAG: Gfo/Idh/MocA family protein [Lachnospiraceae bacterium]